MELRVMTAEKVEYKYNGKDVKYFKALLYSENCSGYANVYTDNLKTGDTVNLNLGTNSKHELCIKITKKGE